MQFIWSKVVPLFIVGTCCYASKQIIKDKEGAYLNCGTRNVLYIESATYGPDFYIPCNNTDVKSFINEKCHGKGICHVITSNATIGVVDPCPGKPKGLTIIYRCIAPTEQIQEKSTATFVPRTNERHYVTESDISTTTQKIIEHTSLFPGEYISTSIQKTTDEPSNPFPMGPVIGSSVGICSVLIAVGVVIIVVRRRKSTTTKTTNTTCPSKLKHVSNITHDNHEVNHENIYHTEPWQKETKHVYSVVNKILSKNIENHEYAKDSNTYALSVHRIAEKQCVDECNTYGYLRDGNPDAETYDITNHAMQTTGSTDDCYDHGYCLQTENDYDTANVLSRK